MLNPAQTVSIFQKQLEPKTFVAGAVIFETGQPGDYMYGILEGAVDLIINGEVIETLVEGDVFGEGALVQPEGTRASTAVAKVDSKLAYLDQARFLFAIQETPLFALEVIKSLSSRLRHLKQ